MPDDQAYLNVEKKIEKARYAKLTELSLRNMNITELPESLAELTHLQWLDLSKNQLTTLPDWFSKLENLWSLDLAGNPLMDLPTSVAELVQLKSLSLYESQLTALPKTIGKLTWLQSLDLSSNQLSVLPEWFEQLTQLQSLDLSKNHLMSQIDSLGRLNGFQQLRTLNLSHNGLTMLPDSMRNLSGLWSLNLSDNQLELLPDWIEQFKQLRKLRVDANLLFDIPSAIAQFSYLEELSLNQNPLNPELAAARGQGISAVFTYLRAKSTAQIILNEAKLILVGEGEVGKSCLLSALRDDTWEEGRPTTHGIEIKPVKIINPEIGKEITLNGWDFGGQRVYRPTHQLFFSAPAVYLVVWKPREGPQQGLVKEWIKLIKHREPTAKILVVATHGGPQQRQPDIDRQELWELFGKDMIIDFLHVESKPDENGERRGIDDLKQTIARVASTLPEIGRSVPKRWQEVRDILIKSGQAYLSLGKVLELCHLHQMGDDEARLFITIEHRLGHLIHYQYDPTLRDIVVLKPNWLATAISFVLDDETTRKAHGLVHFSKLSQLWDNATRIAESRYPKNLHPIFLRLMERFDLSYRVANHTVRDDSDSQILIAQLVPDTTPEQAIERVWPAQIALGDIQQMQICRIVDEKGQTAAAEGLFYQLIVRLHKYSLGREEYIKSVHWQRGLVLNDEYNGSALLRHIDNDVHITVRAPYPERFLAMLTEEVKYLVESFWEGLRCDVMVPCLNPISCIGLFEVRKLIENKKRGRAEQPCPVCNEWQNIDQLLRNAPAAQPDATKLIVSEFSKVKAELAKARIQISYLGEKTMGRFDRLDDRTRRILSRVDKTYTDLLHVFMDEAKEGPRLFSLIPVDNRNFNPKEWIRESFHLTLWCEHSRLPLSVLNGQDIKKGTYTISLDRKWFKKAAPYLKLLTGTLSLVLPVVSSTFTLLDDEIYDRFVKQLDLSKSIIDAAVGGGKTINEFIGSVDSALPEHGEVIRAQGAVLRELHALLKANDPGFGGLVRVMNKRQEFLWVHERFAGEY